MSLNKIVVFMGAIVLVWSFNRHVKMVTVEENMQLFVVFMSAILDLHNQTYNFVIENISNGFLDDQNVGLATKITFLSWLGWMIWSIMRFWRISQNWKRPFWKRHNRYFFQDKTRYQTDSVSGDVSEQNSTTHGCSFNR